MKTITLSLDTARVLAQKLVFLTDAGPFEEGWKSDELELACTELDLAIEIAERDPHE